MIERKSLLADLQQQVKAAETDLDAQVKAVPEVSARLRGEYDQARKADRTAATWSAWLGERVTQVAVAWVLGTVFVRFSEDNELIAEPYITAPTVAGRDVAQARYEEYVDKDDDPTYRGWLETAFAELGAGPAGRLLFDRRHNPLFQIPLSHEGAGALLEFWRRENGEDGTLVHDFTDPLEEGGDGTKGRDTRFLGDLYQELSKDARDTYALFQTPEFVEEFILDRTMNPAVREFGFEGLKMIDPTCGSGHFVLGAFRRLVRLWAEERPAVGPYERVRAALESVHGVDLNPFAVAIARFRLLLAAMAAGEMRTFAEAAAYEWPMGLAVGDSLLPTEFRQEGLFDVPGAADAEAEDPYYALSTEDIFEHPEILRKGRYHVVAGNPPYPTVKDKTLNQRYRKLYDACSGKYALSVPFAQRFFELAKRGDASSGRGYGIVGQITANSFMKREFGGKLIESFFRDQVELTEVIDTSGAHIPNHGTPTVILVGRPREGSNRQTTIRTVRSVQGEPKTPENPESGLVWRAIIEQIDQPGSAGRWVSTDDLDRDQNFSKHPWVLTSGGLEIIDGLRSVSPFHLRAKAEPIGYSVITGEDEAYAYPHPLTRWAAQKYPMLRPFLIGDQVRDWCAIPDEGVLFPIDLTAEQDASLRRRTLWPLRQALRSGLMFSKTKEQRGLGWTSYAFHKTERLNAPRLLCFSSIATTHNHFSLIPQGVIPNHSTQVIQLREGATRVEYLSLLGVLNSSTAGFWLKMVSHNKGGGGIGGGIAEEHWEQFYEFTGTKLQEFPLPASYPTPLATALDALAQELSAASPSALAALETPTPAALREARAGHDTIRARMIALQEELDWQVYGLYQLHVDELRIPEADADPETVAVPSLALGERAFEIVLARRVAAGEASDEWFKRHGSTPITDVPDHWPAPYRALVQKRIDAIEANRALNMIERPEYKRRWATDGWDAMQNKALKAWLLDRVEDRRHWFDQEGNPTLVSLARLTEDLSTDAEFVSVAEIYAPRQDFAKTVRELLGDEHVPFISALRYKPSGLKKRADWEHVWDLQREEDAAEDEPAKRKVRERTPVPPKYTSADFLKPSYWRARGKLDVPKERFVSYGSANVQQPALYGWAGWNELEQALALASYLQDAGAGIEDSDLVPYLAGLLELQPWLDQWYGEYDPSYGAAPATEILGFRHLKQGELGLTDEDLKSWSPAAATRGGRKAPVKSDS
ncbi:BREX-2 system adenine-specific DNA-methyltransferase PglX [Kitasatospora sp. NPDC004531]